MSSTVVRPLRPEDVAAADLVARDALAWAVPEEFVPDEAIRAPRGRSRIGHLQATDPDGAWAAVAEDGTLVGVALALVREGLWGLSLLMVHPDHQGRGIGGELLRAALRTRTGPGVILSSSSPAAMRAYARAGFRLRPCVAFAGILDRRGLPDGLTARPVDPEADRETLDLAARHVRGASYGRDLPVMVAEQGWALLGIPGRGFVAHRDGSPGLLCATDEEAATDLLLSALAAAAPGASVHLDFVMDGHDWAIQAALRCGLVLSPDGPVYVRDVAGTMAPWLPSGAYL